MNPLKEKGLAIDKQLLNWTELNVKPINKDDVHPYTVTRIILMNGIEVEAAVFGHQFARHCKDYELKKNLAMLRRLEQQQQKTVNWLLPGNASQLETTIGYEQVAVDLTAFLAKNEKDEYVKQALDFALLEDFDHLYRYANLLQMTDGKKAEKITGQFTEITVGRPTALEHRHPFDDVRDHIDADTADFSTIMHILTIIAAEQQTMNYYMNVGGQREENIGRGLYQEIAQIEEQHVTHYESLMDPRVSWFKMLVLHEYNECWLYHSLMEQEVDASVKNIWELHLDMEIAHLQKAIEIYQQEIKEDPQEFLPADMPEHLVFESNIEYVREIIAEQTDYNAVGTKMVADADNKQYEKYQKTINEGGVPSEEVIKMNKKKNGREYRQETAPHPLEKYQLE